MPTHMRIFWSVGIRGVWVWQHGDECFEVGLGMKKVLSILLILDLPAILRPRLYSSSVPEDIRKQARTSY